ncbi:vWA domain-containing protein [Thermaerobacter litoralis]
MRTWVAGLERLTERLGRQADLTARLMHALPQGAAGIGEAAVASTCVHLLVVGRPGVVQVLRHADAGRVFYGRSRPGQILHIDVFHADGEVDHRLVARQLTRAARIYARDAGAYRVAGLPVEQIPDYIDLQTGTGGGRASGSLIYGRRLSLRLAHRNHVHLAIGLPRALWGYAVYAVAAVEEAVLQSGLELRRIDAVELVDGQGGAPLDLSDYETASDSLLREEGRPRPAGEAGAGWGWGGRGSARGGPAAGRPGNPTGGFPSPPGAGGNGPADLGVAGGAGGPAAVGGGGPDGWAAPGDVAVTGPAAWGPDGRGPGDPGTAGLGRPHRFTGPAAWREVLLDDGDGERPSGRRRSAEGAAPGRGGRPGLRSLWRPWWGRGYGLSGWEGAGGAAGAGRDGTRSPQGAGGPGTGGIPGDDRPGRGRSYDGPPGDGNLGAGDGTVRLPEGPWPVSPTAGGAAGQGRKEPGPGMGNETVHGDGNGLGLAGGGEPAAGGPPGGDAAAHRFHRQGLLARSLDWLRETGVDLGTALLERLGAGATLRDLQLPGAGYEDLRRWLTTLREAGLLERDGERYRLSPQGWELLALLQDEPATVRTALRRLLRVRPARPDPRPGHGQIAVYDDERGRQANRRVVRPWEPGAGGDGLAVAESVTAALARRGLPLRVGAEDLRLYRRLRRHPVDVCLVLDASASMAGSRIRAAKDLAQQLLVSTRDRVAVITFQERIVQVQVPLTRNTSRVERGLSQIQPYGLTPLAQGLEVALLYLAQSRARNPLLVLITDGIPTVPYRTANPLEDAVQVARQLGQGRFGRVGFTCIGLQPNERYLRELVRVAGGRLYVVDELERDTLVSIVHRERAQRKERARP